MKTSTILIAGLTAVSLSACNTASGSIAKNLAQQTAVQTAMTSGHKAEASTVVMEAPPVDSTMDCAALTAELAKVDATIVQANNTIAGAGTAEVTGKVAATGASQAALHSGATAAIAKVPFGGLFAKKAVDSVADSGRKKAEKATAELQAANLRKASLQGLYAGKNCAA